jgi:hypothetical protein
MHFLNPKEANLSYDLSFSRYKGDVLPNKLIGQQVATSGNAPDLQ